MSEAIVHFGLHKTGTSTTEATLFLNHSAIAARFDLVGRKSWPDVSRSAKHLSADPQNTALISQFEEVLSARVSAQPRGRNLLISNVDLSGHLPGHRDVTDYRALPGMLHILARVLEQRYDRLQFVASTRAAPGWLRSLYWQNLKVNRETDDFAGFSARMTPAADFSDVFSTIAEGIGPHELVLIRLEDYATAPLGPAAELLRIAGVNPQDLTKLTPHNRRKRSPDAQVQAALLELNRSVLTEPELEEARATLIALTTPPEA